MTERAQAADFGRLNIYLYFHFKRSDEFIITKTDPPLWTRAPMTGLRSPVIASIMAIKFNIIEKPKVDFSFRLAQQQVYLFAIYNSPPFRTICSARHRNISSVRIAHVFLFQIKQIFVRLTNRKTRTGKIVNQAF